MSFLKKSLRERNLIFNRKISNVIGNTNFETKETKVTEFPAWCYKTTQRLSDGNSAFHKLTAFISSQKGADKTHKENGHLTPENAVMLVVPWVITGRM